MQMRDYVEFIVGGNDTYRHFASLEEAEKYFADPVADWTKDNTFTLYGVIEKWDWQELDSKYIPAPPQEDM